MKGGGQEMTLANESRRAFTIREHLDSRVHLGDTGRADVDHLDGATGQSCLGFEDARVVLAAVGVALDGDVERLQGLLRGADDGLGKQDDTSAGAECGLYARELNQCFE